MARGESAVELTVRGAGVFGLSVAYACARRGARVRLIAAEGLGTGASAGLVGALAPHVPEAWNPLKQFQLESLLLAAGWWREVAASGGVDPLYARSGRVQPLADEAGVALARERIAGALAHWQGAAEWSVEPASGGEWEPVSPSGWVLRDSLAARISPRAAGRSLVAALRALGAEVIEGEAEERGLVVHATGWRGMAAFSDWFGRRLGNGVKGQAAAFRLEAREMPQVYAGGLHVVPHGDGTVAIGSTSETAWEVDGPDAQLDALIARAREVMPALAQAEVIERWAGIRPRAASRQLVLGAWPGRPGHFIANGGFKIGFGMAPKAAEVMADLLLEGRDLVPERFRPEGLL
ncbi:FAD-dependent oxidoreductase [Xinfangfangia sp. CPCC 101601]|uniref:FAD-dependent oxidoreductase n=1 Tax=Pseudogemmobacter lacusdianii TaxID=3069608 RepID=A0ABU0VXM4_9RHOB|nr:FAD-dependent oxidoreductase [Xinfangfangia sp. CPCC 101601]MDQ2066464.1 FAD-dependent oxidoreductase [Xinfangfangia sp. CPCC 101601]